MVSRRTDSGAVAVMVAVLIGGVLLGMGALVVDVGALYAERRELQNGADFAALSVAGTCAVDSVACATSSSSTAQTYANDNANDNNSAVDNVCGSATGLLPCTGGKQGPWDCSDSRPSTPYVQVRTSTRTGDGGTVLPPILSRTLAGNAGDSGHKVRACARATFGGLGSNKGLALTVSYCEWNAATAGGTLYAPPPPYTAPFDSLLGPFERVLTLHTTPNEPTCTGGPSGWDLPGGFGWLADPSGTCQTSVDAGGVYGDSSGVAASSVCKSALAADWNPPTIIFVPIYDGVHGTGGNGTYHLYDFAAFVLTGYRFPGVSKKSWVSNKFPCNPPQTCISGFFTTGIEPGGAIGGPPGNTGAFTTQLAP